MSRKATRQLNKHLRLATAMILTERSAVARLARSAAHRTVPSAACVTSTRAIDSCTAALDLSFAVQPATITHHQLNRRSQCLSQHARKFSKPQFNRSNKSWNRYNATKQQTPGRSSHSNLSQRFGVSSHRLARALVILTHQSSRHLPTLKALSRRLTNKATNFTR